MEAEPMLQLTPEPSPKSGSFSNQLMNLRAVLNQCKPFVLSVNLDTR